MVFFGVFRFQETAGMIGVQLQCLDDSLFRVETLCWDLGTSIRFAGKLGVDTGLSEPGVGRTDPGMNDGVTYERMTNVKMMGFLELGSITTLHSLKKNRGP